MARKKKHEEHENLERWLVSYADFITLLFAFFVVMYSLSAINEGKFRILAESLAAAFRALPRSHEPIQIGKPLKGEQVDTAKIASAVTPLPQVVALPPRPLVTLAASSDPQGAAAMRAMREMAARLERALAPLIERKLIVLRRSQFWLEVEINTSILFPSGSAELEPAVVPVLKDIAAILHDYPNPLRVEGFTDNVPIQTPIYPSNWELSAARAARVVRLFAAEGITPARMTAVGHGEYKPVAPNDTEDGRRRNRKVVIVVLSEETARFATPAASPPIHDAYGPAPLAGIPEPVSGPHGPHSALDQAAGQESSAASAESPNLASRAQGG